MLLAEKLEKEERAKKRAIELHDEEIARRLLEKEKVKNKAGNLQNQPHSQIHSTKQGQLTNHHSHIVSNSRFGHMSQSFRENSHSFSSNSFSPYIPGINSSQDNQIHSALISSRVQSIDSPPQSISSQPHFDPHSQNFGSHSHNYGPRSQNVGSHYQNFGSHSQNFSLHSQNIGSHSTHSSPPSADSYFQNIDTQSQHYGSNNLPLQSINSKPLINSSTPYNTLVSNTHAQDITADLPSFMHHSPKYLPSNLDISSHRSNAKRGGCPMPLPKDSEMSIGNVYENMVPTSSVNMNSISYNMQLMGHANGSAKLNSQSESLVNDGSIYPNDNGTRSVEVLGSNQNLNKNIGQLRHGENQNFSHTNLHHSSLSGPLNSMNPANLNDDSIGHIDLDFSPNISQSSYGGNPFGQTSNDLLSNNIDLAFSNRNRISSSNLRNLNNPRMGQISPPINSSIQSTSIGHNSPISNQTKSSSPSFKLNSSSLKENGPLSSKTSPTLSQNNSSLKQNSKLIQNNPSLNSNIPRNLNAELDAIEVLEYSEPSSLYSEPYRSYENLEDEFDRIDIADCLDELTARQIQEAKVNKCKYYTQTIWFSNENSVNLLISLKD